MSVVRVNGRLRRLMLAGCLGVLGLGAGMRAGRAQAGPQQPGPDPGPGLSEASTPIHAAPEKQEQEQDETAAYRHSATVQMMGRWVGLNPEQAATAFEALNFLALVVGVGFLAVKTLPKAFRDRSSGIQRQLVDARTATEEAGARLKSVESRLAKLDDEIAAMRKHVEADTEREEQRAKVALEEETAKILAAAEAEIQAATATARRELQRHAAELAIDRATRRLTITAETDRMLIEGFAQRLISDKGARN